MHDSPFVQGNDVRTPGIEPLDIETAKPFS
jgi:hypothetical protein